MPHLPPPTIPTPQGLEDLRNQEPPVTAHTPPAAPPPTQPASNEAPITPPPPAVPTWQDFEDLINEGLAARQSQPSALPTVSTTPATPSRSGRSGLQHREAGLIGDEEVRTPPSSTPPRTQSDQRTVWNSSIAELLDPLTNNLTIAPPVINSPDELRQAIQGFSRLSENFLPGGSFTISSFGLEGEQLTRMYEFLAGYAENIAVAMRNSLSENRAANENAQVNYAEANRLEDLARAYRGLNNNIRR